MYKLETNMEKVIGIALDDIGEQWRVECPTCSKEYEYVGFFDPGIPTECSCGCIFTTKRIEFEDGSYIS